MMVSSAVDPTVGSIPVLHLSYGHRLFHELRERHPASVDDVLKVVPPSELFKGDVEHRAPLERGLSLVRFARDLGLVRPGRDPHVVFTPAGDEYVGALDAQDFFRTTETHSRILRELIADGWHEGGVCYGAVMTLALMASRSDVDARDPETLGRALAEATATDRWKEAPTFKSQAQRFAALLQDAGLVDGDAVTERGEQLLSTIDLSVPAPFSELVRRSQARTATDQLGGTYAPDVLRVLGDGQARRPPAIRAAIVPAEVGWHLDSRREFHRAIDDTIDRLAERGLIDADATGAFRLTPAGRAAAKRSSASRDAADRPRQRHWWVNQGTTYAASRRQGVLWAPKLDKSGKPQPYWTRLTEAAAGDVVLHYAAGSIRAVGRVKSKAVDATRPTEFPSHDAWRHDGWSLAVEYRELAAPLELATIPAAWRTPAAGPFTVQGTVQQGYFYALSDDFVTRLAEHFPQLGLAEEAPPPEPCYEEPPFDELRASLRALGLRLDDQTLRRYHVSLKTRGFVVLSGLSGSGKSWLAEAYATAVSARSLLVPVAPNWTTNEDLLGYVDPLSAEYRHTPFSHFLTEAAAEYENAIRQERTARPYHVVLDEMNLARVEYYFARFLSTMETRARNGTAALELAPNHEVLLAANLKFIGTVNVDETTHGFADKVYDRAQLIEMRVPREGVVDHLAGKPYQALLLAVWDAMRDVAPFAYRVLDEVAAYHAEASKMEVAWETAIDEQLLQKVLPKVRGMDPRIRTALESFIEVTQPHCPLSREKAQAMLNAFTSHGFVSYF